MPQLPKVNCRYGAPVGRPNRPTEYSGYQAIPDAPHKFTLRKIHLNAGGYDSGGAYWGYRSRGDSLYWAESGCVERWLDAKSREAAKATLRAEFPNCSFYR